MIAAYVSQRQGRSKKYSRRNTGRFRQEVRRSGGTEQATGCARTERSPHIRPFTMLQKHQADDRQRGQDLNYHYQSEHSLHSKHPIKISYHNKIKSSQNLPSNTVQALRRSSGDC